MKARIAIRSILPKHSSLALSPFLYALIVTFSVHVRCCHPFCRVLPSPSLLCLHSGDHHHHHHHHHRHSSSSSSFLSPYLSLSLGANPGVLEGPCVSLVFVEIRPSSPSVSSQCNPPTDSRGPLFFVPFFFAAYKLIG
ncbi:hypothetical protein BP00DRAFT_213439 [Aspergillus indologenus CBS 114.80]|uniref:Uncharacterized protein n=1 Tax=Aspergillus indologenus CBS 114.80 TaxID=1450541 RepID=A0A2V5I4T0_9EURO|nr:hypothetical protein BP00DRAFT_213439 [Aspergillus indologenus CBS 114.80]